ncbi:MAG: VOC family protein [Candidatus Marinimicrobia bacterium]|nr:VOC family protein [Candidatus Neomarinimicrobiota bacterium]MCH7763980.1 VOC family protein [Candidatus Neomarinimicrobiota bacterium]
MHKINNQSDVHLVSTIIAVSDLERSTQFYSEIFQWKLFLQEEAVTIFELPDKKHFMLYKKESFAINPGQQPIIVPDGSITATEFYFHTQRLEEVIQRLETHGARLLTSLARRTWGDEAAYYSDPDGNVIAVGRPLKK